MAAFSKNFNNRFLAVADFFRKTNPGAAPPFHELLTAGARSLIGSATFHLTPENTARKKTQRHEPPPVSAFPGRNVELFV